MLNRMVFLLLLLQGLHTLIKSLLKKRMKRQGPIFHELEYLLRDYSSEATRVIKKNNGILDKFIGNGIFAYFGYQDRRFDIFHSKQWMLL